MDLLVYILFRGVVGALNLLPLSLRLTVVESLLRVFCYFKPRYLTIAQRNLELVFPGDKARQREIIEKMYPSLARLIIDVFRLPSLTKEWCDEHIDTSELVTTRNEIFATCGGKGILHATGHIGSFELLGCVLGYYTRPIKVVARSFNSPRIERWWNTCRAKSGNSVIMRDGAFREMIRALRDETDIGFLFDQNVTRNYALFVDWFGKSAATTKALGYTALAVKAPMMAIGLIHIGNDKYKALGRRIDVESIYEDASLTKDEKALKITERAVKSFEEIIRLQPESWFWMHRRWKTQPSDELETFYK